MFRFSFKILRIIQSKSIKKLSNFSDKDFFINLAKHKINLSTEIDKEFYGNKINDENNQFLENIENVPYTDDHILPKVSNVKTFPKDDIIKEDYFQQTEMSIINNENHSPQILNENKIQDEINLLKESISTIPLEELSTIPSSITNVGPLITKNEAMLNFLRMGVDLFRFENKKGGDNILVRLQWERDVVPTISFLKDQAEFSDKEVANIFSHYPQIFRGSFDEFKTVFDYFKGRGISSVNIAHIVSSRPLVLGLASDVISKKLTELENMLNLTVKEMNEIIHAHPKIVVENLMRLKTSLIQLHKIIGFTKNETKEIVLKCPRLFLRDKEVIATNYIFLHRVLNLAYEEIVKYAPALAVTPSMLEQRVKFLIFLKRYQTDPTKELYTPISAIIEGSDEEFSNKVAYSSVSKFKKFLKTL